MVAGNRPGYPADMRVALANDHVGLPLRRHLEQVIIQLGHEVVDFGTDGSDPVAYCDRAFPAAEAVAKGDCDRAVLVCGGGIGMALAANKVVGIRAALVWSEATAVLAREHNDANVISIGARQHTHEEMLHFIATFLDTPFTAEERHARRIGQLADYERTHQLPPLPASATVRENGSASGA